MSSEEEDWEYYDDATTLTDLWQYLKDESLDDDPLEFWQKQPSNSDLELQVHDYWRIKVPLVLAPGYGYTSVDQPVSQEKVKNSLIQPLEAFICGTATPREVFENLTANDSTPSICGKPVAAGLAMYGCRDCAQDDTCVMCSDCFVVSEHKNHNYRMTTTSGNGFCDCGDPEAFLKHHLCRTHEEASKNESSAEDVLEAFPADLKRRAEQLLTIVLKYIITMTTTRHTKLEDWKVGPKEKETWPDLEYPFTHSTHVALLINDDSHSYREVQTIVKKVVKCQDKKAMDLTEYVDKEGRAIIKVGSYKECAQVRDYVDKLSNRDNQPLKVAILPSYLVAHQAHALKLCNWLMELFAKSSGFRALFFQVLMTEDPKIDSEQETKTFMEKLLTTSAITWKSVRKAWMELVVEVALKTPENKIKLGEVYLKHYQSLMNDYMNDDQEPDVSIVNLTVQILTVPSVAHHLVEKSNALAKLVEYFTTIFNDEARYVDGKIDLCEWLEEKTYDYKRCDHILTDIEYVLSTTPTQWNSGLRKNFIEGTKLIIDLLAKLHLADPHVRKTGAHVEYESRNWACVFNIASHLMGIANTIKQWCKEDPAVLKPIANYLLEHLANLSRDVIKTPIVIDLASKVASQTYDLVDFDALREPCSIHIPLNQFLAMLLISFNGVPGMAETALEQIEMHAPLIHLVDPVITVLSVFAQIKCGMWRRNGMYLVEGQHYLYNDPRIAPHNKINDLMMLQAAFALTENPGEILATLLHRMHLLDWCRMSKDDDEMPEETFQLADEFLLIVIGVVCERISVDISDISAKDEMQYRLIHLLLSGDLSHSEVLKNVNKSDSKIELMVEDILMEIADLVTSKKDTTKKVYQLKKTFQAGINPFFYFYTRQQRDEVDAALGFEDKKDIFNKPPSEKWPRLKPLFKGLLRLLASLPMMSVVHSVLARWKKSNVGERTSMMHKHLHKVLFLINLGLDNGLASKSADFIEKFEAYGLFSLLNEIQPPAELKDLLPHTIARAAESRKSLLGKYGGVVVQVNKDEEIQKQSVDNDRKRRAQAAAERKAKVMAQMNQMQKKFADSHKGELAKMEVVTGESGKPSQGSGAGAIRSSPRRKSLKAIGNLKSMPHICTPLHTCILCQEDQTKDDSTMVFATYVINTTVLSQVHPIDPDLSNKFVSNGMLPRNLLCGPVVTSCGHVMHAKCYQTMFDNLVKQHREEALTRANYNVNHHEYLCPICQRLSNTVLPLSPPISSLWLDGPANSKMTFAQWVNEMEVLALRDITAKPRKRIVDISEEMMNFFIDNHKPLPDMTRNPGSGSDANKDLYEMTTNFTYNCFMKATHDLPSGDDNKCLNVSFQAAALTLQLSQAQDNHPNAGLVHPILQRDSAVLQSLVRLSINASYNRRLALDHIQSNGLFNLAMCFNPNLLKLNPSFLQVDMINFMMMLTASMPLLIPESTIGSADHHVVKFCAILYLIQTLAYLESEDTEDNDNDEEEADVQRMASWISQIVGRSDTISKKAKGVRKALLRFLRCSALFFHFITDIPLPSSDDIECDDRAYYTVLSEYLSLPPTLKQLINDKDTFSLAQRLLGEEKVSAVINQEMPPKMRSLVTLPEDYTDLLNKVTTYECPNATASSSSKSKSVAMCLICGALVCFETYCCKEELSSLRSAGGCTVHARRCGADLGLFVKLATCQLVVLTGMGKGGLFPAPYVDRFGEHDVSLQRGNPLKLDKTQYEKLNRMWQQNDLQTYVATNQPNFRTPLDLQWALF